MTHLEAIKPSWTVSGVVEAPIDQVWPLMLHSFASAINMDTKAVEAYSGPQPYVTSIGKPGNGKITVEVNKNKHSLATQGEWWYRGVYHIESHPRGSLVVYDVYNIAPGIGHWAAQWVQGRENAAKMKPQLQSSLEVLGKQLGCKVSKVA